MGYGEHWGIGVYWGNRVMACLYLNLNGLCVIFTSFMWRTSKKLTRTQLLPTFMTCCFCLFIFSSSSFQHRKWNLLYMDFYLVLFFLYIQYFLFIYFMPFDRVWECCKTEWKVKKREIEGGRGEEREL